MSECRHEAPPYPQKRIDESPLPSTGYSRYANCIHCGELLIRPRDKRIHVSRQFVEDHPQFDWSGWE